MQSEYQQHKSLLKGAGEWNGSSLVLAEEASINLNTSWNWSINKKLWTILHVFRFYDIYILFFPPFAMIEKQDKAFKNICYMSRRALGFRWGGGGGGGTKKVLTHRQNKLIGKKKKVITWGLVNSEKIYNGFCL